MAMVVLLAGALCPGAATAQPRRAAVLVRPSARGPAPSGTRLATWRTHVERASRTAGFRVVDDPRGWATERAGDLGPVLPGRLEGFVELQELLVQARAASARLQEGRALALLARAERLAEEHADVPGSAAWLAEVETAMGITAAQAGLDDLMEVSLARAATLDASRGVRAAEAPPAVVARAGAIARAVATRPVGSFLVRTDAPGARVYLDDEDLGPAPRLVRAPKGQHVLRVQAPGHLPWGRVVRVLEGRRPDVTVRLSPDPLLSAARRLEEAGRAGRLLEVAGALAALDGIDAAWIAEVGGGPTDRALLTHCTDRGCADPRRVEVDEVPIVIGEPRPRAPEEVAAAWAAGQRWLLRPPPVPPPPPSPAPWWQRWYVLVGAAALVGAGIGAAVLLTRPEPDERYRVIIDTDALAR